MRRAISLFLAFCLSGFATAASANCRDQPECASLRDLSRLDVVVSRLSEESTALGLAREELRTMALITIRARAPKIKQEQGSHVPYIYIDVLAYEKDKGLFADQKRYAVATITIALIYPLRTAMPWLSRDQKSVVQATLWSKSTLLTGTLSNMRQRVLQALESTLTVFARDWSKVNPDQ